MGFQRPGALGYRRFCELTGKSRKPPGGADPESRGLDIGGNGFPKHARRTPASCPPGFSAEHLGPNDYYYWDDFWCVAGLRAAAYLVCSRSAERRKADRNVSAAPQTSLACHRAQLCAIRRDGSAVRPCPPRPTAGWTAGPSVRSRPAIRCSSGRAGHPPPGYRRLPGTITAWCNGAFFHDIIHSGINPYLTLHIAQVLLRAGDMRYFDLMRRSADLASPTGQWPEAIHPRTLGGCMGDGQHVWAAAEWMMMMRNCFVREEDWTAG